MALSKKPRFLNVESINLNKGKAISNSPPLIIGTKSMASGWKVFNQ
jgi:hypothetical protein